MAKMPPVPPQNRSSKGVQPEPGARDPDLPDMRLRDKKPSSHENVAEQGDRGNIKQNTTTKGRLKNR